PYRLPTATATDRDRRPPHRLGLAPGLVDVRVLAREGGLLLGPQALQHLAGLLERLQPLGDRREGCAVRLVLRREPSAPEPHDRAAVRDLVDGRDLLREHGGVA